MRHFKVYPEDLEAGSYACHRRGDDEAILVQISEHGYTSQTRLNLHPTAALKLAADLISAGDGRHEPSLYTVPGVWTIRASADRVLVIFEDAPDTAPVDYVAGRGGAFTRSELEMSPRDALMFGRLILARTADLLDRLYGDPWVLGDRAASGLPA